MMASGMVTCLLVLALACLSLAKLRKPVGPVGLPGSSSKLKPCPVDAKIQLFFKLLRTTPTNPKKPLGSQGSRGAPGPPGRAVLRRAKADRKPRSTNYVQWPYDCNHVGFNHDEQLVEKNTVSCCEVCRFPDFSNCAHSYRHHNKIVGEYVCNSKAIRCIANCLNKKNASSKDKQPGSRHKPAQHKTQGSLGSPGFPGRQGITCTKTTKKVKGSYCLENSCIKV